MPAARAVATPRTRTRTSETSPRDRQARTRFWPIWIAGGLSLAVSFALTLQLTRPAKPPRPAIAILAGSQVFDGRTLMAAIKAAGLKGSANVRGAIDSIERHGSERVLVKGWAAEIGNGGAPLDVLVFVDGTNRLATQTEGKHADIVHAVGLSDAATAVNVSFEGALACGRGQKLMVVAVTRSGDYGYFRPHLCP